MNQPTYPNPDRDAALSTTDERTWAVIAHVSTLAAAVLSAGWLSILGPFIVWALYKDRSTFVRQAAAGAFNFNLVIWAMTLIGWVLFFTIIGIPLAIIVWGVAVVASLAFHITAAVRANRGEPYRYPWGITVLR
jgi:hypothetical protein